MPFHDMSASMNFPDFEIEVPRVVYCQVRAVQERLAQARRQRQRRQQLLLEAGTRLV